MTTITMTEILDDLRAADEITRRYERRYWLSSADFYELYSQGRLDRRPAPGISFTEPNMPTLIADCLALGVE